jgi:hypothetical protein
MIRLGPLIGLALFLLGPVFLAASCFYPKSDDGHYRLERWVRLGTERLRRYFRRAGWACLILGLLSFFSFSLIID